jgi:hypothetical protein
MMECFRIGVPRSVAAIGLPLEGDSRRTECRFIFAAGQNGSAGAQCAEASA